MKISRKLYHIIYFVHKNCCPVMEAGGWETKRCLCGIVTSRKVAQNFKVSVVVVMLEVLTVFHKALCIRCGSVNTSPSYD